MAPFCIPCLPRVTCSVLNDNQNVGVGHGVCQGSLVESPMMISTLQCWCLGLVFPGTKQCRASVDCCWHNGMWHVALAAF